MILVHIPLHLLQLRDAGAKTWDLRSVSEALMHDVLLEMGQPLADNMAPSLTTLLLDGTGILVC